MDLTNSERTIKPTWDIRLKSVEYFSLGDIVIMEIDAIFCTTKKANPILLNRPWPLPNLKILESNLSSKELKRTGSQDWPSCSNELINNRIENQNDTPFRNLNWYLWISIHYIFFSLISNLCRLEVLIIATSYPNKKAPNNVQSEKTYKIEIIHQIFYHRCCRCVEGLACWLKGWQKLFEPCWIRPLGWIHKC